MTRDVAIFLSVSTRIRAYEMTSPKEPMRLVDREQGAVPPGHALVRVAGCGVCHTDLSFWHDGVRTRHALPLTLGHEISGVVEAAGDDVRRLVGAAVVVPAVIPCGTCDLCLAGRGNICAKQIFPGNDLHGGFATHVLVPAVGLCEIPGFTGDVAAPIAKSGVGLAELAVLADAVSTPWQAIRRSGLAAGDIAVFVGVGGVGGFGVQLAAALGARAVALDVDPARLDALKEHGAALAIDVRGKASKDVRKEIAVFATSVGAPQKQWKIFETSGRPAGQEMAWGLLNHGAYLGVVGFTMEPVSVRLANLMAFDARAEGTWGCLPELYPSALRLVLDGRVRIAPFVEKRPLSTIDAVFGALARHEISKRPVLVPDLA
jgi:6-hydroxycyclohex-1-ene-1-carbonyl-CoA dehydrogenase